MLLFVFQYLTLFNFPLILNSLNITHTIHHGIAIFQPPSLIDPQILGALPKFPSEIHEFNIWVCHLGNSLVLSDLQGLIDKDLPGPRPGGFEISSLDFFIDKGWRVDEGEIGC